MRKPEAPFSVGACVPYEGAVYRVVNRYGDERSTFYSLRRNGNGQPPVVRNSVPHTRILSAIAAYARFKEGDQVYIDRRFITFPVVARKWSFELGTVLYGITDNKRRVILVWKQQETLIEAASLHARALDGPAAGAPAGYPDVDATL